MRSTISVIIIHEARSTFQHSCRYKNEEIISGLVAYTTRHWAGLLIAFIVQKIQNWTLNLPSKLCAISDIPTEDLIKRLRRRRSKLLNSSLIIPGYMKSQNESYNQLSEWQDTWILWFEIVKVSWREQCSK